MGGGVLAYIIFGIGISLNVRKADDRYILESSAGWCGAKSLKRAVPVVQLSMCITTITVSYTLYRKRASRLRVANCGLGQWFGMLPSVPNRSMCVGGFQLSKHWFSGAFWFWEWGMAFYL